jgi:aminoglycoside phosphotransferase (APT) family kinase protein
MKGNEAILQYLTTAPTSNFQDKDVRILDQWQGADNYLWRVQANDQQVVLKMFMDAGQARGRRQFDAQQMFASYGLAPRPLWFDRYPAGLSRQILVYEWLPGQPADLSAQDERLALASAIAQVHGRDPADVRRVSPQSVNLAYFWDLLQGSVRAITEWLAASQSAGLADLFRRLSAQAEDTVRHSLPLWQGAVPTPVHGDLKPENCVTSRGQVVLLDWEMFGLGDPALEIASFLLSAQVDLDPAAQNQWLDTYRVGFDQPQLSERINTYRKLLPFDSLCFLLHGLQRELAASTARPSDLDANREFLLTTIQQVLTQTLVRLLDEDSAAAKQQAASVRPEIERLLRKFEPGA